MKAFLRTIVLGYFYCGIALGFVVWFSYIWGLQSSRCRHRPQQRP